MEQLFYNGKIITMVEDRDCGGKPAEAVLVRDGRIAAAGDVKELRQLAQKECIETDLQGKCLMPAFIDAHSHMVMNGHMSLCADLTECTSFQGIVDTLKGFLGGRKEENTPLIGYGYDHNFLKEQRHPDREILDEVSREIPILILHVSGHLACANSAALQIAGITADTPDPKGGLIGRKADGYEPNGYLEETAMLQLQKAVAGQVQYDLAALMRGMQQIYIENGITTVQDGASTMQEILLLDQMARKQQLQVDVVAYPLLTADGKRVREQFDHLSGSGSGHLRIGGYKLILDGSPQGRSAWMSEPYLGGEEGYCGYPWLSDEEAERYIKIAVEEGQQLLVHCNGDAASEQFLRLYDKVLRETGSTEELRPVMIHCQTVRNDQLDAMARLKMIASIFVGHVWYWGDIHMKNFGSARGNHISPVRDAIDRGVTVNFHQDTPVTKPNMLHSVWCAVNRISRNGAVIGENQRISVYEALKAVTINAAYEYFEESAKGSIEAGKRADLVILDQSPLEVDLMEIKNIQVMSTIKDGTVVYWRR
ncbi:MAG: amidohydrolase [Lachnospiraceae bacterium]|nr:amidohydrolase [Lachnospiraceae bacterium]